MVRQSVWFGFMAHKTIVGYLMPNPFLYIWTILFQTIQFSTSIQFSSIWSIDMTLSGATTPERWQWRGTSHFPKFLHYRNLEEHSLRESYPSAEKQSVYSIVPTDWVTANWAKRSRKYARKASSISRSDRIQCLRNWHFRKIDRNNFAVLPYAHASQPLQLF